MGTNTGINRTGLSDGDQALAPAHRPQIARRYHTAIATVNLGVDSYRQGKAYFFDGETAKVTEADGSWAKKGEKLSKERGKPAQVIGWKADPLMGSTVTPPPYQKLEGDWVDGQEPAGFPVTRVAQEIMHLLPRDRLPVPDPVGLMPADRMIPHELDHRALDPGALLDTHANYVR